MKKIMKNNFFTGFLLLGLSVLVLIFGLSSLSLDINSSPINLWEICQPSNFTPNAFNIFVLSFTIALLVSLVPIVLTLLSIFRKNNVFFFIVIFYQLAIQITFFIMQGVTLELSAGAMTFAIINTFLLLISFGLVFLRRAFVKKPTEEVVKEDETVAPTYKKTWMMLAIDAIMLFVSTLVLFIPLYGITSSGNTIYHILVTSGSGSSINIVDTVFFIVFFLFVLADAFLFLYLVTLYLSDKKYFLIKSSHFSIYNLIIAIAFFLSGFILSFVYSLSSIPASTFAYAILIAMGVVFFVFSIVKGKLDGVNGIVHKDKKAKFFKIETLIYLLVITAITSSALFLNVVVLKIVYSPLNTTTKAFNGFTLIKDYATLGAAYQFVAFYVVTMLLVSSLLILWAITCYFTKYKNFNRVAKVVAYVNVAMVIAIGVMGIYFQIAKALNTESIIAILDYYGIPYNDSTDYQLSSQMIFALIADVVVLAVMLIRKAFDKDPFSLTDPSVALSNASASIPASGDAPSAPLPLLVKSQSKLVMEMVIFHF